MITLIINGAILCQTIKEREVASDQGVDRGRDLVRQRRVRAGAGAGRSRRGRQSRIWGERCFSRKVD